MLKFQLSDSIDDAKVNVTRTEYQYPLYRIQYPCKLTYSCTNYRSLFPPGKYRIKLCGANGGVHPSLQITTKKEPDFPYAGGCTTGLITLKSTTEFFIYLGGHGIMNTASTIGGNGGYNGGGDTNVDSTYMGTSGGGASDIRAEIDDVFHRIIVAGGGGGGDDISSSGITENDGKGGSGGGIEAQGWYTSKTTIEAKCIANQISGFSFGNGESGSNSGTKHPSGSTYKSGKSDIGGAGGGWYGGFASHSYSYGAGGGSSFVLTKDATILQGEIEYRSKDYQTLYSKKTYAFADNRKYSFVDTNIERGVWLGNGFAEITVMSQSRFALGVSCRTKNSISHIFFLCLSISK